MLSEDLSKVESALESSGDLANMRKIRQLRDKLHAGTFIVAFCGHFSAGKSTMINTLLGSKVLPSSPIPTSANVVTVEQGAERVRIFRQDGVHFDMPVSELEQLREYAKDGQAVESIQIHFPAQFLPERVQLMDTPGIDSTDDAHKLATESALHLADLVIYTMDYNHVQSEVNFGFTKTLHERGKAVWLVVNQVDKHNGFELSFTDYQNSVRDAFAAWGIMPEGIFYTTMLDAKHPYNQFAQLQSALQQLFPYQKRLLHASIVQSALNVIEEHRKFLASQNGSERERLLAVLADTDADLTELQTRLEKLRRDIDSQHSTSVRLQQDMEREMQSLIENATLTPFQTTELAGKYLESRRPGFRMGLLFSAAKTEQERSNRLQQLHGEFTSKVAANLDWHIKDLLVKLPETYGVHDEAYANSVYELKVDISPEMIAEWVKEGALTSQEYMYQYAKDITAEVKSRYKRIVSEYIERAVNLAMAETTEVNEQLSVELQQAEMLYSAAQGVAELEHQEEAAIAQLFSLLATVHDDPQEIAGIYRAAAEGIYQQSGQECAATLLEPAELHETTDRHKVTRLPTSSVQPATRENKPISSSEVQTAHSMTHHKTTSKTALTTAAGKLRKAAVEVKTIPGMTSISSAIKARAERLEQNLFTVALFGAFSAGKSSFANAMMGDMLLPVSPNPTTATINKILPPTTEWPHGSARVKLKSIVDMAADIQASLAVLQVKVDLQDTMISSGDSISFFDHVLPLIAGLDPAAVAPNAKPHFSFLKAVEMGLADMHGRLGQELPVDIVTFREYVAQEWKACFVEWIELYHDNPLTAQGIMLIDTPGADSINARHTKVAFEYIKNADAVLFVTYYNHAFSNADREFLIQLGRVKDAFELDKMFFLVNAADLAADAEELGDVVAHVRKNLMTYGITAPQIYPVSSQLALLARLAEKGAMPISAESTYRKLTRLGENAALPEPAAAVATSGIHNFEQDFITFTIEELTELAVQSGMAEIRRALAALGEFIESAKQGEAVRTEKRQRLGEALNFAQSAVASVETESETRAIGKEMDELLYYVQQRVFMRYIDAFNESFSSSVLRDDAGSIKQQLENSLQELLRFIAFDLAQEMRATAVRVEKQVNQSIGRILIKMGDAVESALPGCKLQTYEHMSRTTPEFPRELAGVQTARFTAALSLYKNAKDFFERNTKATMREEIEKLLKDPVAGYVKQGAEILQKVYIGAFRVEIDALRQRIAAETQEYAEGIAAALEMKVNIADLQYAKAQLEALL